MTSAPADPARPDPAAPDAAADAVSPQDGSTPPDEGDHRDGRTATIAAGRSLSPTERVVPSWTDPTVRRASEAIGGPLGRHALVGRAPILTPLRVCLLIAIVALIGGWLFKSACIQQGPNGSGVSLDQSGQRPWLTACYNDVVPLYGSHKLNEGALPYKATWTDNGQPRFMEYPVVTGYWMWGVAQLSSVYVHLTKVTGIAPVPLDVAAYFTVGAILLGLIYLGVVAATARISRRRIWDTAIICASPLLIIHAFTNWDLLAIGLTAGGMLAWARGRPVWAGALLGLGAAAKLYPLMLLGPLLVLCLRAGRMPAFLRAAGAAAVVWAAVNLPVMLLYPQGWYEFVRLNSERPPEYDSWYFLFSEITGSRIWDKAPGADAPSLVNNLSLVLFVLACAVIGWFALSAQRRPRFAQLAFLVIAAFLLTNKVWSPQYSLWLLPLVALALPRWRIVLAWQFVEVLVWVLLMFSFAGVQNKGLSIHPFLGAAILRDVLIVTMIVLVVRDVLRPAHDPVRRAGDDDPSGGVLEDAPDRFTLPSLPALWARRRTDRPAGAPDDREPAVATAASAGGAPAGDGPADR